MATLRIFSLVSLATAANAFGPRQLEPRAIKTAKGGMSPRTSTTRFVSEVNVDRVDATTTASRFGVDVDVDTGTSISSPGGDLIVQADARSQLFSAFTALSVPDQYDAVLTGLCAKLLDEPDARPEPSSATVALRDPVQLMEEMNRQRIPASPRSLQALIDSTVKTQDCLAMADILSLCKRNGAGLRQYGSLLPSVRPLPGSPEAVVRCPDGRRRTRSERLAAAGSVPDDDRPSEVAAALAVSALLGTAAAAHGFHADDFTPYSDSLVTALLAVGVADNFYDVLQLFANMAASRLSGGDDNARDERANSRDVLPDKESMPLGIGTGRVSGTVLKGFSRLLTVDAERESECEAASLFAAYQLRLPCFAFRPNALEAAALVVESNGDGNGNLDPLLTDSGIMRVLVWLFAPVAMENMKHSQLIVSDPREAGGMLRRLEEFVEKRGEGGAGGDAGSAKNLSSDMLWWKDSERERQDLLQWAYAEAELLVRDHQPTIVDIAQRLEGGAATVGDCIATMEGWQ